MTEPVINVDLCQQLKELLDVKEPDLDAVKDTLSRISNTGSLDSTWSPVIAAIKNNQEKALDLLLDSGFFIDTVYTKHSGIYSWCAVGAAIDAGNYKLAKRLVKDWKASSDSVRLDRETLLTTAITRSDWPIVALLLEDLKASPNQCVKVDSIGGHVWSIHLAIWSDFYKGHSDWRMTKLLLKNGANLLNQSDWDVVNGKVLLGIQKGTKGNAATFAEALKGINQGRIEDSCLDGLIEMLKEHNIIQDINAKIKACKSVSLSDLAGLNNSKVFFSSPLVTAAKHGRYDLVELMVRTLGFDVNAFEEVTGMNPLAAAVESRNTEMVRYLVKELGAKVDSPLMLELVPGKKFKCSSLALAVDKNLSDPEMWKLLVEEFGADVNLALEVEGHTTSLLNHAIYRIKDQKSCNIISLLLSYGAKTDKIGWSWLGDEFRLVAPIEQALHLQARGNDDLLWLEVVFKLSTVLVREENERLKNLEPEDLIQEAETERLLSDWHRTKMMTHLGVLTQKIDAASLNDEKIKILKSKKDYLTEEEVANKEREFWRKVSKSRSIEAEIKSILKHENYMTEKDIQRKKAEAEQIQKKCFTCERKLLVANLLQCSKKLKPHSFCTKCIGNKKQCPWCESEYFSKISYTTRTPPSSPLEPMSQIVDPIIAEAEWLLARLQTLRDSKDLLAPDELEILTRKHEAEIERANILNRLIATQKKTGDPEYLSRFKKSLKEVKTALGMPNRQNVDDFQQGSVTVSTPLRACPGAESLATAVASNNNHPPMADPQVESWKGVESGETSSTDHDEPGATEGAPAGAGVQSEPPKYRFWVPRSILSDDDYENGAQDTTEEANATWPNDLDDSGSQNDPVPDRIIYNDFFAPQPTTSVSRVPDMPRFWN